MSESRFLFRYVFLIFILLILLLVLLFNTNNIVDGLMLFVGLASILILLIGKRRIDYFEPIYLFSIYYVFVYVAAFFTAYRGFEYNVFIDSTIFYEDVDYIYTLTIFVCVISYFSVLCGYYLFVKRLDEFNPKSIKGVGSPMFFFIALVFCLIGLVNFTYNIYSMYGGDFIGYYKNISMRSYDFSQGGSTLGYNFLYAGIYMLFIRWLQTDKNMISTFGLVFLSIMVFSSNGRITNTIFYLGSFLMIFYYNKGFYLLNKRFFFVGLAVAVLGVLFYSLRYASSLYYNNLYDFSSGGVLDFLSGFFVLDNLALFLVDKGNIPNFALLMKVVDSWGEELNYMYGSTILFPLYGFISSDLFGLIPMPAVVVKQEWYSHILGGNLPITGMGEMIVNFSVVGFPLGMFFFGALGAFFRNLFIKMKSNVYLIFYTNFCFFYLLYPKGEFNNFNTFWMAFSSVVFLMSLSLVRSFNSRNRINYV